MFSNARCAFMKNLGSPGNILTHSGSGSRLKIVSRRSFFCVMLSAASLLCAPAVVHAFSWDASKAQRALALVRQFQASNNVKSMGFGVALNGESVLATNLDAKGESVKGGAEVRYQIASVSKQFTAAATLALIEDKSIVPLSKKPITFDMTLQEIFPNVKPAVGKITVRQLLSMTSNLPNFTNDPSLLKPDQSGRPPASESVETLELVEHLRTYLPTGPIPKFLYSNTNYFVLSLIIHVLNDGGYQPKAGAPVVREYIRHRILARAGMTMTGFIGESAPPKSVDADPELLRAPLFGQGAWFEGAGDLVSTVSDMDRWNVALASGRIVQKALLQETLVPSGPVVERGPYMNCRYAMGLYVCDMPNYRLFQHDGVIPGFMASNAIGRKEDGSWVSATILGNRDSTPEIITLVRRIIDVAN